MRDGAFLAVAVDRAAEAVAVQLAVVLVAAASAAVFSGPDGDLEVAVDLAVDLAAEQVLDSHPAVLLVTGQSATVQVAGDRAEIVAWAAVDLADPAAGTGIAVCLLASHHEFDHELRLGMHRTADTAAAVRRESESPATAAAARRVSATEGAVPPASATAVRRV